MIHGRIAFTLAAAWALFPALAQGREWHLRPPPHDSPSLDEAIRSASPGDTIVLSPGVYPGGLWIERSGEPGRPITIRAQQFGTAVIQGGGESLNIGGGAHDLVFDGLEVRGSSDNLVHIQDGAHAIVLRNLRVHDAGDDGDGIKVNQARDIRIEHVECFHPGRRPDRPDGNPAQECIDLLDVAHAVVVDSYLHDGGNMLLYAKGGSRDVIFERNVLIGQGPDAIDPCLGIGAASDPELLRGRGYEAEFVVARNNLIVGCHAGAVGVYDALHAWIVNNTFVDDGPDVVQFRAGNGPRAESRDIHFANDLFADPAGHMVNAFVVRSHAVAMLEVRNDLYWNAGHPLAGDTFVDPQRERGATVIDPNLGALGSAARWAGVSGVLAVPRQGARDAGAVLEGAGAVRDDWYGRARPGGARIDVGAIETDATSALTSVVDAWPSEQRSAATPASMLSAPAPETKTSAAGWVRNHSMRVGAMAAVLVAAAFVTQRTLTDRVRSTRSARRLPGSRPSRR